MTSYIDSAGGMICGIARRSSAVFSRSHKLALWAGAFLVLSVFVSGVQAASMNYGDFMGDTVTYVGVTEASVTDPIPLFGSPTVSGDSIDFNPTGFAAFAQDGDVDLTDGQLSFMVVAKPGNGIQGIKISEAGVTTVIGNGTDATRTDVSAVGVLNIHEVDGMGVNTISIPINLPFSHGTNPPGPPNGTNGMWTLATMGQADTEPWTGMQMFDLNAAINAAIANNEISKKSYILGATKISINLDNGLVATSEDGTIALIDKKDFGGLSITIVPEPTSLALCLFGLLGLAVARRVR